MKLMSLTKTTYRYALSVLAKACRRLLSEKMDHAIEATKNNTGIILNLAINYGGQAEILHAVRAIAQEAALGRLAVDK